MLLDCPGHEEKLVNVKNLHHFYIRGRAVVLGRNKNWSMVKNCLICYLYTYEWYIYGLHVLYLCVTHTS